MFKLQFQLHYPWARCQVTKIAAGGSSSCAPWTSGQKPSTDQLNHSQSKLNDLKFEIEKKISSVICFKKQKQGLILRPHIIWGSQPPFHSGSSWGQFFDVSENVPSASSRGSHWCPFCLLCAPLTQTVGRVAIVTVSNINMFTIALLLCCTARTKQEAYSAGNDGFWKAFHHTVITAPRGR